VEALAYIGAEVSLPVPGSRSRTRGYVAELSKDGSEAVVCLYPESKQGAMDEVIVGFDELRVLKAGPPSGWWAVDVHTAAGEPWLSLRFGYEIKKTLARLARKRRLTLDEAFNELLRIGIEGAI
jgi:hypothetical protein